MLGYKGWKIISDSAATKPTTQAAVSFLYMRPTYIRMSQPESDDSDPEIDRINLRISRSFLDVVDETWRERGFNSRSEFIRYALRDSVNHPEGAGFWKDMAISEAQLNDGDGVPSEAIKSRYGTDDE